VIELRNILCERRCWEKSYATSPAGDVAGKKITTLSSIKLDTSFDISCSGLHRYYHRNIVIVLPVVTVTVAGVFKIFLAHVFGFSRPHVSIESAGL
jgi:hypothetical protein